MNSKLKFADDTKMYDKVYMEEDCNSICGGVLFDMPPLCRWQISIGVKDRVVNRYIQIATSW